MNNKPGWDARKRNRNIGTAKSGHGQNNVLTIPEAWADMRMFYEKLKKPIAHTLEVNGNTLTILVEAPLSGFCHACTPQDIEQLLVRVPAAQFAEIKMIVLRQPKKKERILSPVWGRLHYWSNIEKYSGPSIHIDAQPINARYQWKKSLSPDDVRELKRLEQDGHQITSDRRYHYLIGNLQVVRHTQLYRTLPHEIGHYVDYYDSVTKPAGDDDDKWDRLNAIYETKPGKDKEDFAHRYASEFFQQQVHSGHLPFDRRFDPELLLKQGFKPAWFSDNH